MDLRDSRAGVKSVAIIQRIGRGRRHREHCLGRLDLFRPRTTIEGHNGYVGQRLYS